MRAVDRSPDELQLQAQWAIFFVYTHNFRKYCPILIVLSLLQTAIMYPQNVIEFPTLPIVCCCITLKNATAYTSSRKPLNKSAMHAIILLLQSRKFWWYLQLTVLFSAASRRHNDVILLPVIHRVSGNDFVFQQDSASAHRTCAAVELLRREVPNFLVPNLWSSNSPDFSLWITGSGLSRNIVSTRNKSIVWMNWNCGSSMSGAILNSLFLTRLLTSGEEDFERVSMVKEDTLNTACELTMLILSISVTFNVTCLTVTSFITKSYQQRWPLHSCSFY